MGGSAHDQEADGEEVGGGQEVHAGEDGDGSRRFSRTAFLDVFRGEDSASGSEFGADGSASTT